MTADKSLNVNSDDDKTHVGIHSKGKDTVTNVILSGNQIIQVGSYYSHMAHAYGIYNEDGAKTNWQLTGNNNLLTINANSSEASSAYGIYTTGMNSQATIGSLDNDDLTFNIMGQTGLGNLSAIMANDYGVNEINAKSINMQNSLSDSRNHSQEEQNIFEVLTVDIDTAADKYAKVVDDYGKYASQADYFQALDTAKKELSNAIDAYNRHTDEIQANSIFADLHGKNDINLSDGIQAYFTVGGISNNIMQSAGIFANHDAENTVQTSDIAINTQIGLMGSQDSDIKDQATRYYGYGIKADNNGKNIISMNKLILQANVSGQTNYYDFHDNKRVISNTTAGVGAYNGATNDITAKTIDVADLMSTSITDNFNGDNVNIFNKTTNNIYGLEADSSGFNQVRATDVNAIIGNPDGGQSNSFTASLQDYSYGQAVKNDNYEFNIMGVKSSDNGISNVIADLISVQMMQPIGPSIYESEYASDYINISDNIPINLTGVYADRAVNQIRADDIYAIFSAVNSSYGSQIMLTSDKNAYTYSLPITVQGVVAKDVALNTIDAENINVDLGRDGLSFNNLSVQNNDGGKLNINLPLHAYGTYQLLMTFMLARCRQCHQCLLCRQRHL